MRDLTVSELEWLNATVQLCQNEGDLRITTIEFQEDEIVFYDVRGFGVFETTLFQGFGDIEEGKYYIGDSGVLELLEEDDF